MEFYEAKPSVAVSHVIQNFWMIKENDFTKGFHEKIIPDGYPEMIFHYGDSFECNINGRWELQESCLMAGQIRNHFYLKNTGQIGMFALKLKPWVLKKFFNIPMDTITDQVVAIDFNRFKALVPLRQIALSGASFEEKVSKTEHWIATFLEESTVEVKKGEQAVHMILDHKGTVSIQEIAYEVGLTRRGLEHYFKTYIGVSPKFYSRIIRFSKIFELVQEASVDWAEITFRAGYYDQSHFIKNFKEFTGEEPSRYGFTERNMANFFLRK
ncbi:MAG: helix-turn-helix domain-containing protein [Saonia sp.]